MPRISRLGPGNHNQRRAQHALGDQVTLLQHVDHGIGLLVGVDHANGLVAVRVELLARRIDFGQRILLEGRNQLLQRQLDASLEALGSLLRYRQSSFEAVLDGQQFAGEPLDGELVRL